MPYLETLLVLLLVVGSVFLARGISRLPTPWWGIVVIAFGVARRFPEYAFIPPFSWLMHGRVQFIGIGMALTILLITPVRHLENERQKRLVWLFMIVIVLYTSISPVLLPAVLREHHENLDYLVDENEICHQPNDYTCGPAAAVTALRRVGINADMRELTITAYTTPITGTYPDLLCWAIESKFSEKGVSCTYRHFESLDELRAVDGIPIAIVKLTFLVDHYVTILAVTDDAVVVGDPMKGRGRYSHDEFLEMWRRTGVIVSRDS